MQSRIPEIDKRVGRMIRLARNQKGYTIEQASTKIGVSHSTWQGWEEGQQRVPAVRLIEVAQFFEQPVASFFGFPRLGSLDSSEEDFSDDKIECLRFILEIDDRNDLKALNDLMQTWAHKRVSNPNSL